MKLKSAIYAGFFGASGSLFGKLIGSFEDVSFSWIPQTICFFTMLLLNTLNMKFFINSLQETNETLRATVMSSGFNFFFSFVFGALIFNENISFISIIGMFFILCGLYFSCDDNKLKNAKIS